MEVSSVSHAFLCACSGLSIFLLADVLCLCSNFDVIPFLSFPFIIYNEKWVKWLCFGLLLSLHPGSKTGRRHKGHYPWTNYLHRKPEMILSFNKRNVFNCHSTLFVCSFIFFTVDSKWVWSVQIFKAISEAETRSVKVLAKQCSLTWYAHWTMLSYTRSLGQLGAISSKYHTRQIYQKELSNYNGNSFFFDGLFLEVDLPRFIFAR